MTTIYAPCGIDCQVCDCYIATQNDDKQARKKMAQSYKEAYGKDIDPETIVCDGCSASGRHIAFCDECQIRVCSHERGYATCAECAELPCDKGSFIWTETSQSLANLKKLRSQQD